LFCGIELKKELHVNGVDLQNILMEKGLLAKATKGTIIRFAPPLVITKEEVHQAVEVISEAIKAWE
jgi:acetylornithine/succinyldiaminopimelate/putrescine aminotransferase